MSATGAVEGFLGRLEQSDDPAIFISVAEPDDLRAAAVEIDRRPAEEVPLRGLVFGVKDNIDVAGLATTAACPAFAYQPTRSAPVVEKLLAAGAIPVGKTNMDQFATGLVGTRSPYGVPRNPHDPDHVPGGSSSGSAVAVATGLVDFALGTDTAGSGRVPAAFCGLVGLKPTFGLVSTRGTVPAVRTADCISVFADSIDVAATVFDAAVFFDRDDPFSRRPRRPRRPLEPAAVRIGRVAGEVLADLGADAATVEAYEHTLASLAGRVASIETIDPAPFLAIGDLLYGGPWLAERLAAVGPVLVEQAEDMDPTVATIIAGGAEYSAVDAARATYALAELRRQVDTTFEVVDALALPTVPHGARLSEVAADPVGVNSSLGRFTTFANLADLCALSLPAGRRSDDGLPTGITYYGPAFEDEMLLGLGGGRAAPAPSNDRVHLAVAGAHLRGQPLEHQLTDLDARFVATTSTAPNYRLFALDGAQPPKPGLVFDLAGTSIEVDVWELSEASLGRFLRLVPAPLALGRVVLADGVETVGFTCEPRALNAATEVTEFGGWRNYRASL